MGNLSLYDIQLYILIWKGLIGTLSGVWRICNIVFVDYTWENVPDGSTFNTVLLAEFYKMDVPHILMAHYITSSFSMIAIQSIR